MSAISLADLRAASLLRADMNSSNFIATTELDALINVEAGELHDLVVSALEDQFTTTALFTVTSGDTYALSSITAAAPFYKLRGLDRDEGGGVWRDVRKFDFNERNDFGPGMRGDYARAVRYRLIGASIYLAPASAAPGNYRLWYVPGYVDMAAPSDTLEYPENWYEYVINGVAAKLLEKEESESRPKLAAKEAMRKRILAMAPTRDASGPATMMRVRNRRRDRGFDFDDDET